MPYTTPPNREFFKAQVWELVCKIPPGSVATYGQIAALLPPPPGMDPKAYAAFGARWVGGAVAACPEGVPWQRVVNAQGKISLPGAAAQRQRELLEAEGIEFDNRDRINLKKYAWRGPNQSDQPKLW